MTVKKIVITPETHWDREWYLPFQEYRARLVQLMDKLLRYFKEDPDYSNFTLDGQTIPLLDYLEVKPHKRGEIEKFVKEGRLSIGPFYILPDEFLISGESMIRNLMLGHKIANEFGKVMKAGYIPDPFGHIAQLPQILAGFQVPSVLFMRGFGNEYEENNLNMEFIWQAPGNAASILGIHLILGYGSVANLNTKPNKEGIYEKAFRIINRRVKRLSKEVASDVILLNNGSDHLYAQPEISTIVKQWNERHNDEPELVQQDFEYYVNEVLKSNPELKTFQGELRGGKYFHLLSGVFSARMWIKQENTAIEYSLEKYAEPFSAMAWALDNDGTFEYPADYLLTGWKWLMKNHPHDSICGCSIDEVHDEMKTRFQWARQIGDEVLKESFLEIVKQVKLDTIEGEKFAVFVLNPLPWDRKDVTYIDVLMPSVGKFDKCQDPVKIVDETGKEIQSQNIYIKELPRYTVEVNNTYRFSFLAEVPALGYRVYYVIIGKESEQIIQDEKLILDEQSKTLENEYFKVKVNNKGCLDITDKESGKEYKDLCVFEDVGDWGDEYDYSWPKSGSGDERILSTDFYNWRFESVLKGPTHITAKITHNLNLPVSLSNDRKERSQELVFNPLYLYVSLYRDVQRVDFRVEYENKSKDHRLRVLFPSNIKSDVVHADGHFYVVPRSIELPNDEKWAQKALGTNHQKDFVSVNDDDTCFSILNKGLPEYEAIESKDGTITLAITLLRCIEWLSRSDLGTRFGNAGPDLNTPGGQCLGSHTFEFSLAIQEGKGDWLGSNMHVVGKEFNCPLKPYIPASVNSMYRSLNKVLFIAFITLKLEIPEKRKSLPLSLSFFKIDNLNIQLSALKKAENDDSLIFRLINMSYKKEKANLTFKGDIISAKLVNLLEESPHYNQDVDDLKVNDNTMEITMGPHVLANIKINLKKFE